MAVCSRLWGTRPSFSLGLVSGRARKTIMAVTKLSSASPMKSSRKLLEARIPPISGPMTAEMFTTTRQMAKPSDCLCCGSTSATRADWAGPPISCSKPTTMTMTMKMTRLSMKPISRLLAPLKRMPKRIMERRPNLSASAPPRKPPMVPEMANTNKIPPRPVMLSPKCWVM